MVNLKERPYYLSDEQIQWVKNTINSMTLEEKIGQLFINLTLHREPEYITELCEKYHIGGVRWQGGTLEEIYEQNRMFQEKSKVPVLIAANCEQGGNGAVREGTLVAPAAACGACSDEIIAAEVARVSAQEAKAIGCNWTFAPVSDILMNWRNTIVNTRSYGNDVDKIIACSKAYHKEMKENGIACATKHFPGDGVEERDQHLLLGCNDLSCEEWDATFGKVYQALIEDDIESIMVGQICLPAYTRKFYPDIKDSEIKPATLAPELLQNLLREQLGFQGLIVTDASHMAGLTSAVPRRELVPGVIAAGCDMILFFHDMEEDFNYMLEGYKTGIITEERLVDALHRILGLKAKLGLDKLRFPSKDQLQIVGCEAHHKVAEKAADESVTLVKDTQKLLPINPANKKRVMLYFIQSAPVSLIDGSDKAKQIFAEELRQAGFDVTVSEDYYELEMKQQTVLNRRKMMAHESIEAFKKRYDLVFVVYNMKGYAQTNNVRISYSVGHSFEIPWFVQEVPTIAVSLSYTNHLYDVPMMKTFINAYADTKEYIHAVVEKVTGTSEFKGAFNELVWCDRWDTKC